MNPAIPKILIIDDVLGRTISPFNRDRDDFCLASGLQDVTGDCSSEKIDRPLAIAHFCSGQREIDGYMTNDLESAMAVLDYGWRQPRKWALVMIDMHFKTGHLNEAGEPGGHSSDREPGNLFGMKILAEIRRNPAYQDIPIIILSSMEDIRDKIEKEFAMKDARTFIDKRNLDGDQLIYLLNQYGLIEDAELVGASVQFLKCLREARVRAYQSPGDNILILGETGTGKELVARYIHRVSGRGGPFVPFFAQTIPKDLVESELFGYRKGAFTGATEDRSGKVAQAHKGTLFIDEFGDLPHKVQTLLLRLLDRNTREYQAIGAAPTIHQQDIQVVMATNRDDALSRFRSDILFRVNARNPIILPPLRERTEDIANLTSFFSEKFALKYDISQQVITDEAFSKLNRYDWPGNIRELENTIENAVFRNRDLRILTPNHFKIPDRHNPGQSDAGISAKPSSPFAVTVTEESPANLSDQIALSDLLTIIERFSFQNQPEQQLRGQLQAIESAFQDFLAKYLAYALAFKFSHENRKDKLLPITATIKWMLEVDRLKTTEAKRRIQQILRPLEASADSDPFLILARALVSKNLTNKTPENDAGNANLLESHPQLLQAYQKLQALKK